MRVQGHICYLDNNGGGLHTSGLLTRDNNHGMYMS